MTRNTEIRASQEPTQIIRHRRSRPVPAGASTKGMAATSRLDTETGRRPSSNPRPIHAVFAERTGTLSISRGYLDDECDGLGEVSASARARPSRRLAHVGVGAARRSFTDTLPVARGLTDELDQILFGLEAPDDEPRPKRARAPRRSFDALGDRPPHEHGRDERQPRSVAGPRVPPIDLAGCHEERSDVYVSCMAMFSTVDALASWRLHRAGLQRPRARGAAPWFSAAASPEESRDSLRSRPVARCPPSCAAPGGDPPSRTGRSARSPRPPAPTARPVDASGADIAFVADRPGLKPRDLTRRRSSYLAQGKSRSPSLPRDRHLAIASPASRSTSASCGGGRFEGIMLRESDNLVVEVDDGPARTPTSWACRLLVLDGGDLDDHDRHRRRPDERAGVSPPASARRPGH